MKQLSLPQRTILQMVCAVRRLWLYIKYWLPPLLWMSLIFLGSADRASVNRSSRILEPLFRWLFPEMSDAGIGTCILIVRKCAHLTEYAFFAILIWRALRQPPRGDHRPWSWREPKWALLIVFAYACLDELHQTFVPGRQGAIQDVLLDTLGGAFGLVLLWRMGKLFKRW
jgi:VanZ family protein